MTNTPQKVRPEEYRSRWGARASNPLEGALASSVGSTPASSVTYPSAIIRTYPDLDNKSVGYGLIRPLLSVAIRRLSMGIGLGVGGAGMARTIGKLTAV